MRRAPLTCRTGSRSWWSTTAARTTRPRSSPRDRRRPGTRPDGTVLRLLKVPHRGKGAAVRAGMLATTTDLAVFADADMATPPDQLPALVAALADHELSLGSRIQPDGSDMRATQPRYRRLLGRVFHVLASVWVVGPVKDTQCGFKGFTRAAAHDLFPRQQITSIVFDVELIYMARRRGYRMAIVPVRWYDRRGSRMRARPGLALRVAWDLFRIPLIHGGAERARHPRRDRSAAACAARECGAPAGGDRRLRRGRRRRHRGRRRHARLRLPRLLQGGRPTARRAAAVRHGLPDGRPVRPLLLPAHLPAVHPAVRAPVPDDRRSGPGPRC